MRAHVSKCLKQFIEYTKQSHALRNLRQGLKVDAEMTVDRGLSPAA
eukprot:COSAG02_NODE_66433_length_255_cov_0.961538_1_plen_45_part_10